MATVHLDGAKLSDWPAFHRECRQAFGFPDYYGDNMDAWVDCMSYLRDDEGMTKFQLSPDETLKIDISNTELMRKQAPDILSELEFCIAVINERYADYGEKPALELVLR